MPLKPDINSLTEKRDVGGLVEALNYEDRNIRWMAVTSLAEIGGDRATAAILEALKTDPDDAVRATAAQCLGETGEDAAVADLIEALRSDSDWEVRGQAARALGRMGDKSAAPLLIETLRDDADERAAIQAAFALGDLGDGSAVPSLIEALDTFPAVASEALLDSDELLEQALAAFARQLKDQDPTVRESAARRLARLCLDGRSTSIVTGECISTLESAAASEDAGVRGVAESALKEIDPDWRRTR